jgi:WD40 repeat protein
VETGKELRKLAGHTARVYDVNLTADGRLAVTCSEDNTMRVWGEKK